MIPVKPLSQTTARSPAVWMACNFVRPDERTHYIFSEAANKKVQGYIDSLTESGLAVEVLSVASINPRYLHDRFPGWPAGLIRAIYLPARSFLLAGRVLAAMGRLITNQQHVQSLFVYNYMPAVSLLALFARFFLRKRVVLDYEDGLFLDRKGRILKLAMEFFMVRTVDACVLVNRGLERRLLARTPFMVLNGIFPAFPLPPPLVPAQTGSRPISLLYSGNLSADFGLDLLIEALAGLDSIEVHITGSGKSVDTLTRFIQGKAHVHYHGFVSVDDLQRLESQVDGFVLFQNEDSPYYQTNFPSKLFHYLHLGKPVYFNRCSMFEPYEAFENARVIEDVRRAGDSIRQTIDTPIDTARLRQQIEAYNLITAQQLKGILLGHE